MPTTYVESLIDAAPLPQIVISGSERILAANAGALELLGPGIVGRHYIAALRQPTLLDGIEAILGGTAERAEAAFLSARASRDTSYRTIAARVELEEGPGILVSFVDTTELQEAGQMRRDFVANVSHELKTPLTALMGFIETLRGAARDDPAARARFLEIMEREAGRMNRLVKDLLSLSRVEAEERVRPTERVDIAGLLRSSVASLRQMAEEAGVAIALAGAEVPVEIRGDADQLLQVASNLIENALKYGAAGGRIEVTLTPPAHAAAVQGPAVSVVVRDFGEGMDPHDIPRLTERFYRVDSHRSREKGGTGLGLAIVKHIVNRHRGRLRIESVPGEGSTFTVILPAS
ncbi:sensor histidine kinase [Ovoidimarina sediminis]|uniref:sensor histidine kinase n=1 Tax=Ovoidimarina sediminis TaxID=3079856 RepID=UPI0029135D7B|nr:ATP-binding protein [Rhodophyticola sp. MJ-SS7]MDU8941924.1 ATP-binding protein [Rhodophyticola sp. MJ-SS7]